MFNLADKKDLQKYALSDLSIYYKRKNMKKSYQNYKFKISAPTWDEELETPDRSHSISDIQ